MVINYYGGFCFRIQSGESVFVFNPPSKESKFKSPRFQADVVLINKNHKDFNGWQNIAEKEGRKPFVIDGPGEYELKGVYILGVGDKSGNTIYSLNLEDINLCHLGTFNEKELDKEMQEKIGPVEILFIPVGKSFNYQNALKIVAQLEPEVVIPMYPEEDKKSLKKFIEELGNGNIKPQDKLTIKKKDIKDKKTEVVLLNPA